MQPSEGIEVLLLYKARYLGLVYNAAQRVPIPCILHSRLSICWLDPMRWQHGCRTRQRTYGVKIFNQAGIKADSHCFLT